VVCVDYTDEAELKLRAAINLVLGMKNTLPAVNVLDPTNPQYAALKRKLNSVTHLTQLIHEELASL
jgi:hypothetical protein